MLSLPQVFEKAGKQQVALVKDKNIFYMVLNRPMNMVDFSMMDQVEKILDEVENSGDKNAILVTINSGPKVFSSGFNLKVWAISDTHRLLSIARF